MATFKDLRKAYPEYEMWDEDEEKRLEKVQALKLRGKGAPKKKKSAAGMSGSDRREMRVYTDVGLRVEKVCREEEEEYGCIRRVRVGTTYRTCTTIVHSVGVGIELLYHALSAGLL